MFHELGFTIMATRGTARFLDRNGIPNTFVNKVSAGRPHVVDAIKNKGIQLVFNTASGGRTQEDGFTIRRSALKFGIPYVTTLAGAEALARGVASLLEKDLDVKPVQEYYG